MKGFHYLAVVTAVIMGLSFSTAPTASADMGGKPHAMAAHHERDYGHDGPEWKDTLTEEQRSKADMMHLELEKSLSLLEAGLMVRKAELANLLVAEKPDTKAVTRKIGEIVEIKREMMEKKYGHMMEMRGILTPEQRVSFDMGVLKKVAGDDKKMGR